MSKEMPIKIGTKVYASAKTAARAKGVARGTIYAALARGKIDTVGLGRGGRPDGYVNRGGSERKQVKIGPVVFESRAAAAKALGYGRSGINKVLDKGGAKAKATLLARAMAHHREQEERLLRERTRCMDV